MPFPPRGYRAEEYPLHHEFGYRFELTADDEAQNSTILTLISQNEGCIAPESINVNPKHGGFAEETGTVCQPGSIIPKMMIKMEATLNEAALFTDNIKVLKFNWCPLYIAFLDSLEATDDRLSNSKVEDIFELSSIAAGKNTFALYAGGTKLNETHATLYGSHPLSTVNLAQTFTHLGLTTDAALEQVAFNADTLFDSLKFYSNAGMVRKAMGKWSTVVLNYQTNGGRWNYFSNNFTHPMVKRSNAFTFCGILFHLPLVETEHQIPTPLATAGAGIQFHVSCSYPEWNHQFDQTTV